MSILCTFVDNWEKKYDHEKYPLLFYRHLLKKIK